MQTPTDALICAILLGGWTFMWLTWSFQADIRSWIGAVVFPKKWRVGKSRRQIAAMSYSEFTNWLVKGSYVPLSLCQLMTCQYCWSAHIAGVGSLILFSAQILPLAVLPLVWACGAAVGNLIYDYSKRTHKN